MDGADDVDGAEERDMGGADDVDRAEERVLVFLPVFWLLGLLQLLSCLHFFLPLDLLCLFFSLPFSFKFSLLLFFCFELFLTFFLL